jgi:hypothetical protein
MIRHLKTWLASSLATLTLVATASVSQIEAVAIPKPPLKHEAIINRLIHCESSGANVSRPDSDGINSDGILQFHRGPKNTLEGGTWEEMSRRSGIMRKPDVAGRRKEDG